MATEKGDNTIIIPAWWMALARLATSEMQLTQVRDQLATVSERAGRYSASTIQRFLAGESQSITLAQDFTKAFRLPPFVFFANSLDDSMRMQILLRSIATTGEAMIHEFKARTKKP